MLSDLYRQDLCAHEGVLKNPENIWEVCCLGMLTEGPVGWGLCPAGKGYVWLCVMPQKYSPQACLADFALTC